jgi:hypothetical protein
MVFNTPSACGGVIDLSFWVQGLPWGLIPLIKYSGGAVRRRNNKTIIAHSFALPER